MLNLLHEPPFSPGGSAGGPGPLSVDEFHRRLLSGEISESRKVELIRGRLVEELPMTPMHATVVDSLLVKLNPILPGGWYARDEKPITLVDSQPLPDISVIRGQRGDFYTRHPNPSELALVVEVSVATLRDDRAVKRPLYAEAGISHYWIVNLVDFQIEVHSQPAGGDYGNVEIYAADEAVPLIVDGGEIGRLALAELLPPGTVGR